jgi:hypothetical protein
MAGLGNFRGGYPIEIYFSWYAFFSYFELWLTLKKIHAYDQARIGEG